MGANQESENQKFDFRFSQVEPLVHSGCRRDDVSLLTHRSNSAFRKLSASKNIPQEYRDISQNFG